MAKTAFFTLSLVGKAVKKSEHTVNYVPGFEATSSDLFFHLSDNSYEIFRFFGPQFQGFLSLFFQEIEMLME